MPDPKRNMPGGTQPSERARELRNNATNTERALWQVLRDKQLGWRFRRQFVIAPYIVDFACPEARLVIEADWRATCRARGSRQTRCVSQRKGRRILRFWNDDILANRDGVSRRIMEALGPDTESTQSP